MNFLCIGNKNNKINHNSKNTYIKIPSSVFPINGHYWGMPYYKDTIYRKFPFFFYIILIVVLRYSIYLIITLRYSIGTQLYITVTVHTWFFIFIIFLFYGMCVGRGGESNTEGGTGEKAFLPTSPSIDEGPPTNVYKNPNTSISAFRPNGIRVLNSKMYFDSILDIFLI